jgi:hypothetical protein
MLRYTFIACLVINNIVIELLGLGPFSLFNIELFESHPN